MSTEQHKNLRSSGPFKVVGRDSRIDLSRYTVTILGREVIDYEKLKREDPKLYNEILNAEKEWNSLNDIE